MSLNAGSRIGGYEVTGLLGKGGMGEVYRARDSRLNRDVAIKVLPAAFADDPGRMARFEREAQVLAALNHPNIAAVYGLESGALVMELVEGDTLAERIAQGPIPLDEALAIARQIAEALEAAHEKGIVHRDLKPANVKITPDGKVKVLDFGLAKAFDTEASGGSAALTNSPTLTLEATRAGVILGTAGYMSPEQARGKPADKRADIWSFGVVLFEMLTGRATFEGETVSDTLAAVLRADLDWKRLPADTPMRVRRLLNHCLQRDPKRRLRDIGDAWLEIDAPAEAAPAAPAPRGALHQLPWAVAALLAIAAAWGWLHTPPAAPRPVTRWSATLTDSYVVTAVSLSRDGTRLAYCAGTSAPHISLRMLDHFDAKPVPGGDGFAPVFSPDGQWIAFNAQNRLKKMPVNGGTSIALADAALTYGIAWGDDDSIIFNDGANQGLKQVSANGGGLKVLTTPDTKNGEVTHRWPYFLPGARAVLYTIGGNGSWDAAQIAVLDLKTGARRVLVKGGTVGRYVPTGHLVYARGTTLFAVPFDAKRLEVTGAEVPVVEGVTTFATVGFADYGFANSGLLVYAGGGEQQLATTLEWVDRKGGRQAVSAPPQVYRAVRLSPDGARAALVIGGTDVNAGDIWVYEFARGTLTKITFDGFNSAPLWTPDGSRVTFRSVRNGKNGIYWVPVDGSAQPELLLATDGYANPTSWSPDGKTLLFVQNESQATGGFHLSTIAAPGSEGSKQPREFLRTQFSQNSGRFSPDGKWVAYSSNESGQSHVYVRPFPGPGGMVQVSTAPGAAGPEWSRNGKELFYRSLSDGQLWVVDVQAGATFQAGTPRALFKEPGIFDISPDGQRILLVKVPQTGSGGVKIEAVVDWFEELRRRAPVKK
jgi:serine/threonine-protein kinase